jgi:hypothetical protein
MVWDAGAFMKIAIGVFFLAFGAGAAYALFRLASVLKGLTIVVKEVAGEVRPLLTRVETTLDGVNAELDRVEQITGSAAEVIKVAEQTTTGIYGAVSKPLKKASGLATGVRAGFASFLGGKEKGD